MSYIQIPGFGPGAVTPTRESIAGLHVMNVIPSTVRAFASRSDFMLAGGMNVPPPLDGSPKFWCNPYTNKGSHIIKLRRDDAGNYLSAPFVRDVNVHPILLNINSASANSFLETRKMHVPLLDMVAIKPEEFGRMSLPEAEVEDPEDYPIGEVFVIHYSGGIPDFIQSSFPTSVALFMHEGVPCAGYLDSFLYSVFPLPAIAPPPPPPTAPVAFNVADVIKVMTRLTGKSADRLMALPILSSSLSDQEKLTQVLRALK